jgi:NAD(P)-dependent dehydrogenase (short-subunit alcohol dehydrogenase family)
MKTDKVVVLITGCSGGLGAALVRNYLDADYRVFATVRDLACVGELEAVRGNPALSLLALDVCDAEAVSRVVAHVERCGRLDALIVNAGTHIAAAVESIDLAQAESLFNTNLFGALHCVQAVAPIMRKQKSGKIIGISSLSAQIGLPCDGIYAASKAAMERVFESLRAELAPFRVVVSVVIPSTFPSNLLKGLLHKSHDKDCPYYSLLVNFQKKSAYHSGVEIEAVAAEIMSLMSRSSVDFRIPADEQAASVLAQLYRMSDKEREVAVTEWSGTDWWSKN